MTREKILNGLHLVGIIGPCLHHSNRCLFGVSAMGPLWTSWGRRRAGRYFSWADKVVCPAVCIPLGPLVLVGLTVGEVVVPLGVALVLGAPLERRSPPWWAARGRVPPGA